MMQIGACTLAIMKLAHHGDEFLWAAKFGHDPPQPVTTTYIEEGDIRRQPWGSIWGSSGFSRNKHNRDSSGA